MQASRCVCGSVPSSGDDLPGSCPPLLSELARLAGLPATSLHCKMRDSGLGAMFPLPEADRPSWQGAVTAESDVVDGARSRHRSAIE